MNLVLLDRDGVINLDLPSSVTKKEDFSLLPKAAAAIRRLNEAGLLTAVVTNQACVGRGDLSEEGLAEIHTHMEDLLQEEGATVGPIFACTSPDPSHLHRKPNPGLLLDAMAHFGAFPDKTVIIGDALRDIEAAKAAGCHSILVKTGKGAGLIQEGIPPHLSPLAICDDLFQAASYLVEEFT